MKYNLKLAKIIRTKAGQPETDENPDFMSLALKTAGFILVSVILLGFLTLGAEAAYGLNPNIRQVKTAKSSTIYYLDHKRGLKKAYNCAQGFLSYGNQWKDVKVITESQLAKFDDVNLIKLKDDKGVYYVYHGQKALIKSAQEFLNYGFGWSDVVTVSRVDFDSYRSVELASLINVKAPAQPFVPPLSNSPSDAISVSLSSGNPKDGFIVVNTSDNLLGVYDFNSKSSGPVKIESLTFDLKGVFSSELIKEIYLTNDAGTKYDSPGYVSGRKVNFYFRGNNALVVQPGEIKRLKIYCNLAGTKNDINQQIQISIDSASNIGASAAVNGSFPAASAKFMVMDGSDIMGKVEVNEESLNAYSKKAIVGINEQVVMKFSIAEITKNEDLIIKTIGIENHGTADRNMIGNFKLKNQRGGVVASAKYANEDRYVAFDIKDYVIAKNSKETFTVTADIIDGDGKNYNFNIENIKVTGKNLGLSLPAKINILDETFIISREYLGITSLELKENRSVFSKQKGVIIGNFQIRNNNQKISIKSLEFKLEKNAKAPCLDSTVYIVNYETGEVYGSIDGIKFSQDTVYADINGFALAPKAGVSLALITDVPAKSTSGDYYQVILTKISYSTENYMIYNDEVSVPGVRLGVSRSSLYVYPNYDLKGLTYIKGQKGVKLATYIFETATGEDITINSLAFAMGATSGTITYENGFSNARAYINGSQVGEVVARPFGATFEAKGFNYRLRGGSRVEVILAADTVHDLRISQTQLVLSGITATGFTSGIPTSVTGLNKPSYNVFFDISGLEITAAEGGKVTAGEKGNLVASFKIKNVGIEEVRLGDLSIITSNEGFSYSLGYTNLRIVERKENRRLSNDFDPVSGANRLGMGGWRIKSGEEAVFEVYVDAEERVPAGCFDIYFSGLTAEGVTSRLVTDVAGDPTDPVKVIVN